MLWIYLIVQSVGLGIIAWCFKIEDKDKYAATFGMGSLLSLLLVVVVAPVSVKLLTGLLIVLFRSKVNLIFVDGQESILSYFRANLPVLSALGSTGFDLISRLMPERLNSFLAHSVIRRRQEEQTADVNYRDNTTIDIEAIEVTRWF